MQRGIILPFFMALLIVSSAFVMPIGRTTYDNTDTQEEMPQRMCASQVTLRERIQCRFQNSEEGPSIPEACRNLDISEKERCRSFYSTARPCYALEGTAKDACFRRVSGLGTAAISGEADKTKIRNYLVTLLYDLEERVEAKFDSGEITTEEAADLTTLITDIKEKILSGGTREEVRPMLQELRVEWNEVMV